MPLDSRSSPLALPCSSLSGVVLCGGRSERMGFDKALLEVGGRALLDRAIGVLREACEEVLLACGPEPRYADRGLTLVLDGEAGSGPLAGLVASLEAARQPWLCALAVDLPRVEPAVIARLVERAREARADCCLFETQDGVEPLLAVYGRSCLGPARAALAAGQRRMVAFHPEVRTVTLREAELPPALRERRVATNLNTPEDAGAEEEDPEASAREVRV